VQSASFNRLVTKLVYQVEGTVVGGQAKKDALELLEARASFDGPTHPVALRMAEHEGRLYVDLGSHSWESVEVDGAGWRIVRDSPVRFYRSRSMGELPRPVGGGALADLCPFVNCTDRDFPLIQAWLLSTFRPSFPTPILALHGEQGSAKSTTARVLQSLVDPGTPAIRSAPRNEQDLIVAALNRRVLAFDNLSGLADWLSDALCRLVTDGGFSTRQLYSDAEEMIFEGRRVLLLNGIDELARRADLADRSLVLTLPRIPEEDRKGGELIETFERARPMLFGSLLDALVVGLKRSPEVKLDRLPRMADFARWGVACESRLAIATGSFLELYMGNRREAAELTLDSDPVATTVREFMEERSEWEGSPSALLESLQRVAAGPITASRRWPKLPNLVSSRLKRLAPALRGQGINVEFGKVNEGRKRRRSIRIVKEPQSIVPIVRVVPSLDRIGVQLGVVRPSQGATSTTREPGEDDDEVTVAPMYQLSMFTADGEDDE
jgi:hypothetical protein